MKDPDYDQLDRREFLIGWVAVWVAFAAWSAVCVYAGYWFALGML